MNATQTAEAETVFDALLASLRKAADFNKDDAEPPAAVLWPDEKREWERLVPRLRMALPQFLVLGPHDPPNHCGPAIWLRCVLAGKIPELAMPAGAVPVVYLPGYSRATIRATEDCPPELRPLAELQYRGAFWTQVNAKDWTVAAFLQAEKGGLHLKVGRDAATATSLKRVVEKLADVPVADLRANAAGGELTSGYFDSLISDDPVDDLLSWMADPKGTRDRWEAGRWETLCSRCVADYGFDPTRDGELVGAEKLGTRAKAAWKSAWKRFAATPARYPGLPDLLRRAKPAQPKKGASLFTTPEEAWPQDNDAEEEEVRQELKGLPSLQVAEARKRLAELDAKHAERRNWVWAKVGRSPLAEVVRHLAVLADATQSPLGGATTGDMVTAYTGGGWRADAAALDAIAATPPGDREMVGAAVAHVYGPWLRDAAELFQGRVKQSPIPGRAVPRLGEVSAGTCVLFADGLRYDLGRKFEAALAGRGGTVEFDHHFVGLPSVTPTAKPAVAPVAARIKGTDGGGDFRPCVQADGKALTTDRFRKLLDDEGVQFLGPTETGDPSGRGWTEFGNLDSTGHNEGVGLARRVPELLDDLVRRVEGLLAAGWQEVRVVTDHGWLVLPGGLPKADLPKFLAETRWGRCAVVKPTAAVEMPCFPWFWNDDVRVACPPGIGCFVAGKDYNHGGLSLQECVVPRLTIRRGGPPPVSATIESFKWAGLRCRVKVAGTSGGCRVDLRDKAADPATSLATAKPVGPDGTAALVVTDDAREGSATTLVLLDPSGTVLDKSLVTVGG